MKAPVEEIKSTLIDLLSGHIPPLRTKDGGTMGQVFEGTIPTMQGKQKVDGHYFASIVEKPTDVRLYFFPIYTHPNNFSLSDDLKKSLKGKSCFHIKKLSPELETEISKMIDLGVRIYQNDGIV
ncbi:MAG: hypothetical protein Salg2KO_02970 [Salibacteraceae bacterium]